MKKLIIFLITISSFLVSCDEPYHTVCEGKQNMIVYNVKKVDNPKMGTYLYYVTDASGDDWSLYSFQVFNVGDTLHITNK